MKANKFDILKPNKSSPYFQLLVDNPRAFGISQDKYNKLPVSLSLGLTKPEIKELIETLKGAAL